MAAGDGVALFIRAASEEAMQQQQIRTDLGILSHLNQTMMTNSSSSSSSSLVSTATSTRNSPSIETKGGEDRWGKLFSLVGRTNTHGK